MKRSVRDTTLVTGLFAHDSKVIGTDFFPTWGGLGMVAYEFYSLDPKGGYQIFGVLPERRKSSERVTQESIMNLGKKIFGNDLGPKDISFVQVTLNENKVRMFRIVLGSVLAALSTIIIVGLIVNSVIARRVIYETQERVKEALNGARWLYTSKINEIDQAIYLTSVRYILRGALEKEKAYLIKEDMKKLIADYGLDFLTLVDEKGIVLFRFHNPSVSGDSLIRDPFIREAIKNKRISGTRVLSRSELLKEGELLANRAVFHSIPTPKGKPIEEIVQSSGMVLESAHPVLGANGKVLGALMGGMLLNRNYEIVDRIKSILFKDAKHKGKEIGTATVFLGGVRISTNVIDREGNRATGTRAMKEVEERVLGKGLAWIHRAFVVDDWYITAYEPIRDIQDKIVGMLYVGILDNRSVVLREASALLLMFGILIAVVVFFALKSREKGLRRIFIPSERKLLKRSDCN